MIYLVAPLLFLILAAFLVILSEHYKEKKLRRELREFLSINRDFNRGPIILTHYRLIDPYEGTGIYRKTQLHLHTANSVDVRPKRPVQDTVDAYRNAGYEIIVLTDHDVVTHYQYDKREDRVPLIIPGMEQTIPFLSWPFGRHLLHIGVGEGEILAPAHLHWRGNLGTGRWYREDLEARRDYKLLEIFNLKSNTELDLMLWHAVLRQRGWSDPVWGIAVDDSDNGKPVDRGWIMVKTNDLTAASFLDALRCGRFYATTGPLACFGVEGGAIKVQTEKESRIRFLDAYREVVAVHRGGQAEFKPRGDEEFVRVEVIGEDGHIAWSQPFFLVAQGAGSGHAT